VHPSGAGRPVRGKLGWGLTTAIVDDQDVVIEKLNPDNPEEYLLPDGSYETFRSPPDHRPGEGCGEP
jgi:acyl-homoserine lactone acylase PvdQ